jgi:hypothetical protein
MWRNRGELAEGWYDPSTLQKARQSAAAQLGPSSNVQPKSTKTSALNSGDVSTQGAVDDDSDSDDSVGPMLPGQEDRSKRKRKGPSIPNTQDLELKRGIIIIIMKR